MITEELLLPTDYTIGDQILAALYPERVGRLPPLSTERYVAVWPRIVEGVEHGYGGIVAEYQNDLAYRDMLERLLGHTPPALAAKLQALTAPWDRRFLAATHAIGRSVLRPLNPREEQGFWWFRVPAKLDAGDDPRYASYMLEDWARHFPELYPAPTPTLAE